MTTKRKLILATRESLLALQQAELVKAELLKHHPDLNIEFLRITTEADKRLDMTLTKIGGKGLFVKELEEALYEGRADIAVHSMKDVPMHLPNGLGLPAMTEREDARDVFVSNQYESIQHVPSGANVGTSSLRRKTQIALIRKDLNLQNIRGNIHTRLKRLDEGDYDAIILASAGLKRINLTQRIKSYLSFDESLPAAGQGAMGIECRENDHATIELVKVINHANSFICVTAERALCRHLGGDCNLPIAAYAELQNGKLHVRGLITAMHGDRQLRAETMGDPKDAEALGIAAAEQLRAKGAESVLAEFK